MDFRSYKNLCVLMNFSELVMLFEINQKIINVFFPGLYFFSIQYNTRTCGALSLCGPTRVDFFKNTEVIRSFSRNLATNRKSDMDMVGTNYKVIIYKVLRRDGGRSVNLGRQVFTWGA